MNTFSTDQLATIARMNALVQWLSKRRQSMERYLDEEEEFSQWAFGDPKEIEARKLEIQEILLFLGFN